MERYGKRFFLSQKAMQQMVIVFVFLSPSSKGMMNGKCLSPKVESAER